MSLIASTFKRLLREEGGWARVLTPLAVALCLVGGVSIYNHAGHGTGHCSTTTPNVPDGPDPWGGCFPGPNSTGVPAGTSLTTYTGSCTITTANTTIDSKTVNCDLSIQASNVTIQNSKVNGQIVLDTDLASSTGWSMTIIDTEVDEGTDDLPAICCGRMSLLRVNAYGGHNGAQCDIGSVSDIDHCTITDSYFHDPYNPPTGDSHLGGFLSDGGDRVTLTHNTVWCNVAVNASGGGCTGDIQLIPNFAAVTNATIHRNLLGANIDASYCTYGGQKPGFDTGHDIVYTENVFQRGSNDECAAFGPVANYDDTWVGAIWSNNVWADDGTEVPPAI